MTSRAADGRTAVVGEQSSTGPTGRRIAIHTTRRPRSHFRVWKIARECRHPQAADGI
ncbi:hypothetical protein ABZW10_32455 [Kitasatospora sp. NPDC004723]|uniref:hypothetical protein n=1 Tax=Kitasatospora sp. NPDC004723 TaxID=3154288 RepID=UPI0033BCFA88